MTVDLDLARRVHRAGLQGPALCEELGVPRREAHILSEVGRKLARIEGHALTEPELLLMRTIAAITREELARGITRSPQSRWVSTRARKSSSWCAAVVGKRLFVSRHDRRTGRAERGLGLVELAGNGFVWLTPAGWSLIFAMEAAR